MRQSYVNVINILSELVIFFFFLWPVDDKMGEKSQACFEKETLCYCNIELIE